MKKNKIEELVDLKIAKLQSIGRKRREHGEKAEYLWLKSGNTSIKEDVVTDLDKFEELSGKITVRMTAIEPLHIGSGLIEIKENELVEGIQKLRDGKVVIPGSSIKGVVRHYMGIYVSERVINNIFGSTQRASKVQFSDAVPVSQIKTEKKYIKERYGPKNSPKELGEEAIKFYFNPEENQSSYEKKQGEIIEIVPKGSTFKFEINFKNMNEKELGVLFLAMGMEEDCRHGLKIGGGKSQGLGLVKFEVEEKESFSVEYKNRMKKVEIDEKRINGWIKEFWKEIKEEEKFKKIKEWLKDEYPIK
jgi:CRISPR/Cas system CSM-associated protein Csm3 (group 7 of RAMP superfamily)